MTNRARQGGLDGVSAWAAGVSGLVGGCEPSLSGLVQGVKVS